MDRPPPATAEQPATHSHSVLALMPAWNEATRMVPVLEAVLEVLPVLVVDDGSEDNTAAVAQRAGASVVRHAANQGKGVSLVEGFAWALDRGYDAVLTIDADGQHDPADIPKFLAAYEAGEGDLIIGRRNFSQMPFPRFFTNPLGSWMLSRALGTRVYDNQSGYRLHSRRFLEMLDLTTTGFEMEVEVIIQAICKGVRIGWVDIRTIYDVDKTSYFHPIKDTARFVGMVWRARRARRSWTARGRARPTA